MRMPALTHALTVRSAIVLGVVVLVAGVGVGDASAEFVLLFLVVLTLILLLLHLVLGLFGLVTANVLRFLQVECGLVDVPVLVQVPVGAQAQFLGIVIHFFGLQVLLVVAGVPLAVAVAVDGQAQEIGAGRDIDELKCAIADGHGAQQLTLK